MELQLVLDDRYPSRIWFDCSSLVWRISLSLVCRRLATSGERQTCQHPYSLFLIDLGRVLVRAIVTSTRDCTNILHRCVFFGSGSIYSLIAPYGVICLMIVANFVSLYWRKFKIKKGLSLSTSQMISHREAHTISA
jgi:hypothetical protein